MSRIDISEAEFIAKLNRVDSARQFFVQMWRENPDLLKNADARLIQLMTPIWAHDRLKNTKQAISKPA